MKFIFVHIPKTAGTSLRKAIEERLGIEITRDVKARVGARTNIERKTRCLIKSYQTKTDFQMLHFGHFYAGCYGDFNGLFFKPRQNCFYATFLRDPLQRAISHFYYWKKTYVGGHPIWEKFTKENWSLEEFLINDEFSNFQSRFFWRFPITNFNFIGLTERFDVSVKMLGYVFPKLNGLKTLLENTNSEKKSGSGYSVASKLAEEFKSRNKEDYVLYQRAVESFEKQKQRLKSEGLFSE